MKIVIVDGDNVQIETRTYVGVSRASLNRISRLMYRMKARKLHVAHSHLKIYEI